MQHLKNPVKCTFISFKLMLNRVSQQSLFKNVYLSTNVNVTSCFEEQLKEIFKLRNTNVSTWIVEDKIQNLCLTYIESEKKQRQYFLEILSMEYAVDHNSVCETAQKLFTEPCNERQMIIHEKNLRNVLIPPYQWLFTIMGRLKHGVKFLVDLRTDILAILYCNNNLKI